MVEHGYFAAVNTERQSYWLGFITADGSISGNTIHVDVTADDAGHLELLRFDLSIGNTVKMWPTNRSTLAARAHWSSPQMVADLAKLGVVPRKSWSAKPASIAADLERHYWRGVVDGDGTMGIYPNRGQRVFTMGLCGTLAVVEGFAAFCDRTTGVRPTPTPNGSEVNFAVAVGGSTARRLAAALYDDCGVALARKLALYHAARIECQPRHYYLRADVLTTHLQSNRLSLLAFCKRHGFAQSQLWHVYRRRTKAHIDTLNRLAVAIGCSVESLTDTEV